MAFILGIMIWACAILWAFVFAIWAVQFLAVIVKWVVYKYYVWKYSR